MKYKVIIIIILFILFTGISSAAYSRYQAKQRAAELARIAKDKKFEETKITIIEGWTNLEIASYLEKQGIVNSEDFMKYSDGFTSTKYGILKEKPLNANLEGFLFPDTYRIAKREGSDKSASTTSEEIISKMIANLNVKFTPQMRADSAKQGLTPYEILILASIIERETGRNIVSAEGRQQLLEERKIVAGIFYNRLKIGMALGSDATINFITKKNAPQAEYKDLEIDSPYNTYKYQGLPPGPIGNPSESSLIAAAYPTVTDYYYFLHTQPEGKAIYSKTFEEHVQNKNRYLP
jgi:UPF0755 protein